MNYELIDIFIIRLILNFEWNKENKFVFSTSKISKRGRAFSSSTLKM